MEVWNNGQYVQRFTICRLSGGLGLKNKQGDLQVPEGFYKARRDKARRLFHVNYPNAWDRKRGATGGGIQIHGGCSSIGCVSFLDRDIYTIYNLTDSAVVHIFPSRPPYTLTEDKTYNLILIALEKAYTEFNKTKVISASVLALGE